MKDRYSVLNRVKKKKIPNKPRKYGSLVFDCLNGNPFAFKKKEAPKVQEPLITGMRKFERRILRNKALEKIRVLYPLEEARKYNSKKKRRKIKGNFDNGFEYNIFCEYVKSLSRSHDRTKGKLRKSLRREKGQRRSSYEKFIKSPEWESRKNTYYQAHARLCSACGTTKFIHLHHMVYGEFGKEPDEHLTPLCKRHHALFHKENGTQRHMIRQTMAFIEKIKESLLTCG